MVPFIPCEPFHEILHHICVIWSISLIGVCIVAWIRTAVVLFKIGDTKVTTESLDCYGPCHIATCGLKTRSMRLLGGMLGIYFVTALMYVWLIFAVYVPQWGTMDHAFHWRVYMLLVVLSTTIYILWEFTTVIACIRACFPKRLAKKE